MNSFGCLFHRQHVCIRSLLYALAVSVVVRTVGWLFLKAFAQGFRVSGLALSKF